jgi:hypothetical protein
MNAAAGSHKRKSVWGGVGFAPGADGVTGASVDGDSIAFRVESGEYSFQLRE